MKNISFFKNSCSKSWFIQYTDEHGTRKQISTRCNLKADALRFLHEHKAELSERKAIPKTLSSFTTDFLLYAESQYRTGTVDLYRLALASFMESVGNIPMNAVTVHQVDTWKAAMTETKSARGELFSVVSVNVYFRSLKAAFNTAARRGLVKVNPFLEMGAVDFERRFFVIRNTDTFKTKTGRERAVPLSDAGYDTSEKVRNLIHHDSELKELEARLKQKEYEIDKILFPENYGRYVFRVLNMGLIGQNLNYQLIRRQHLPF